MSEDNQENGAANGDVPEIELIIKDKTKNIEILESEDVSMALLPVLPVVPVGPTNDQYLIFELKSDSQPMYSYVITHDNKIPPDISNPVHELSTDYIVSIANVEEEIPNPYTITVEIPVENNQDENCKENSPKRRRALVRERLAEAVDAVVNKDMTIGKAAKAFEVTKSTLWKEVNKHTNHRKKKVDEDLNKKIADLICAGESLSEISRTLKVAKSTIHLHKVRLAQTGQLPSNVTFKPPVDKNEQLAMKDRIIKAFRGIRVNGMSIRLAAEFFSVPRSTLWKHIRRFRASQQTVKAQQSKSPKKVLTEIFNENTSELTSEQEDTEAEDDPAEEESEVIAEDYTSDGYSTKESEGVNLEDFDLLDAYCEDEATTLNGAEEDFLITFDFDTFEEYVKRELD